MRRLEGLGPAKADREAEIGNAKGDGKLTFDRLTDVFHSGTRHDEDQPVHLVVADLNICSERCTQEFGNPCQTLCLVAVYADGERVGHGLGCVRHALERVKHAVGQCRTREERRS